jgi:lysosomal-associated transmembrane protein
MRWKFERDNYEEYKCCFCLHVRTGTLLLGLFHLLLNLVAITLLVGALLHPEWVQLTLPGVLEPSDELSLANKTNFTKNAVFYSRDLLSDNLLIGLMLSIGSLALTLCLIYGTILGRPQYITPFFCIQVFDLCLTGMTMLGYFSDIPDLKKWIALQHIPYKERILAMDNDQLTLMALILFVLVLSIKMYFIGIVWGCYKYLKQREGFAGSARLRVYDREGGNDPEDTQMLLPPKYEDVLRMSEQQTSNPPPAYAEEE